MTCGFPTDFSMVRGQHEALTPLKSASKIRIASFVPPSPNLRLGGVNSLFATLVEKLDFIFCSSFQKSSFGEHKSSLRMHKPDASQTKILEIAKNDWRYLFEALCNGV